MKQFIRRNINGLLCLLLYGGIAIFAGYSLIRLRRSRNPSFLKSLNFAKKIPQQENINPEDHLWNLELHLYKQVNDYPSETFLKSNDEHKSNLVSEWRCSQSYYLLVLIISRASNYQYRNSIRYTWGNQRLLKNLNATIYFLISKQDSIENNMLLDQEQNAFNDILFSAANEDSKNVVYKTLIGIEWAKRYCEFKFLLKTYDNVYVSLNKVISIVTTKYDKKKFVYAGHYISSEQKDNPDYISGNGIIMNKKAVASLYYQSLNYASPLLHNEDAYVGMLAKKALIEPDHEPYFELHSNDCIYISSNVIKHAIKSPECMYQMFVTCLLRRDCKI